MNKETFLNLLWSQENPIETLQDIKANRNGKREELGIPTEFTNFVRQSVGSQYRLATAFAEYKDSSWTKLAARMNRSLYDSSRWIGSNNFLIVRFKGTTYAFNPSNYPNVFQDITTDPDNYRAVIDFYDKLDAELPEGASIPDTIELLKPETRVKFPDYVDCILSTWYVYDRKRKSSDTGPEVNAEFKSLFECTSEEQVAAILGLKKETIFWSVIPSANVEEVANSVNNEQLGYCGDAMNHAVFNFYIRNGLAHYVEPEFLEKAVPVIFDEDGGLTFYDAYDQSYEIDYKHSAESNFKQNKHLLHEIDCNNEDEPDNYIGFAVRAVKTEPELGKETATILLNVLKLKEM